MGTSCERDYRQVFGNWSEETAAALLKENKFADIVPLNEKRRNHRGGDILMRKSDIPYFFSVEARDRLQADRVTPNPSFNIYPEVVKSEALNYGAIPAWLTIAVDRKKHDFSAFWGLISEI